MKNVRREIDGTIEVITEIVPASALEAILMQNITHAIKKSTMEIRGRKKGFLARISFNGRRILHGIEISGVQMSVEETGVEEEIKVGGTD